MVVGVAEDTAGVGVAEETETGVEAAKSVPVATVVAAGVVGVATGGKGAGAPMGAEVATGRMGAAGEAPAACTVLATGGADEEVLAGVVTGGVCAVCVACEAKAACTVGDVGITACEAVSAGAAGNVGKFRTASWSSCLYASCRFSRSRCFACTLMLV